VQRRLTHAVEADVHSSAVAAARPDETMQAFLNSCDGRWVRTVRMMWLQLSNEETTLRMQRYLRQPLSVLHGLAGTRGLDKPRTVIDPHGDALLSGYHPQDDCEHSNLHNALCRLLSMCASQAHILNRLEGGKSRASKKRPADVRLMGDAGSHGWTQADNREVWADITVVCPVLPTYARAAAATRGAAAAQAAAAKRNKYRCDIPGFAFFLPLAFETEGYHTTDLDKLLLGFAHKRAARDGLVDDAAKQRARCWTDFWLNQFAITHARFLARCVLNRAAVRKDAANPSFTPAVDLDAAAAAAAAAGHRQHRPRACPLKGPLNFLNIKAHDALPSLAQACPSRPKC
jgi:hypothetical protein